MGTGSSKEYNLDDHGHSGRELFDEYVAGDKFIDLSGKVVAVTGTSTKGMGLHLAEIAIKKNAKIVLCLNRKSSSAQKGEEELKAILKEAGSPTEIQAVECDLQDLESVKKCAERVNDIATKNGGLDILICNAGVMANKDVRTKDGFDVQMQTNQLSHFLLTKLVWPSIVQASKSRGEARVATHSSSARFAPYSNIEKKFFEKCEPGTLGGDNTWLISEYLLGYSGPWQRYHQTKLANACFAMGLHEKVKEAGLNIIASSADPGIAASNLQVTSTKEGLMSGGLAKLIMKTGHSPADGSLDIAMGAFGKDAKSGDFYQPSDSAKGPPIATIIGGVAVKKGTEKLVLNKDNIANTWTFSEEAVGEFKVA